MYNMKYILFSLMVVFLLGACQPEVSVPTNLAERKALLAEQKKQLRELQMSIDTLQEAIYKEEPPKDKPTKTVSTMKLVNEEFKRFTEIQASIQSDDVAMASSETGGRITYLKAKEGQYVKKGQLIAKVDLDAIDKQVDEINTSLSLAKDTYQRQKRLWEQNIGSEMQYLQTKNNVERLEQSLKTLDFQKTKANVYAPISGAIDKVMLKEGEMSSPGLPIVEILNTYKVKVVANLPENYLGKVKRGELVDINFPALQLDKQAKITLVGRSIDSANRTFKIEIEMSNKDQTLKPNLLAIVKINDLTIADALIVPQELVLQEISGKEYVMVVSEKDGKKVAAKKYVEQGESYDGKVQIVNGITTEDELIVVGARNAKVGDPLEINNPEAPMSDNMKKK